MFSCAPDARGAEYFTPALQGQNFKMITSAKHKGYISVRARVRSMRVPNTIHHEGRGCKCSRPASMRARGQAV